MWDLENATELTGGEGQRQLGLLIKRRGAETNGEYEWKDVIVVGELKRSKWPLKKFLLQLTRYMHNAFTAQLLVASSTVFPGCN